MILLTTFGQNANNLQTERQQHPVIPLTSARNPIITTLLITNNRCACYQQLPRQGNIENTSIIVDNVDNTGKRLIYNEKLLTHPVDYAVSIQ